MGQFSVENYQATGSLLSGNQQAPYKMNRVYNIDTACVFGNMLTMYRLDSGTFIQTPARKNYYGKERELGNPFPTREAAPAPDTDTGNTSHLDIKSAFIIAIAIACVASVIFDFPSEIDDRFVFSILLAQILLGRCIASVAVITTCSLANRTKKSAS